MSGFSDYDGPPYDDDDDDCNVDDDNPNFDPDLPDDTESDVEGEFDDRSAFQNPGGNSALRAATKNNPRIYSCPMCKRPNMLTRKDVALHYQCDICADQDEKGW